MGKKRRPKERIPEKRKPMAPPHAHGLDKYLITEALPKPGEFTGTFRWSSEKKLHSLPALPANPIDINNGWAEYFATRSSGRVRLAQLARLDPSFVDGLSFPLSVAHMLHQVDHDYKILEGGQEGEVLNLIVLGAAAKTEERILLESCYWAELGHLFPDRQVRLTLCGPEISATRREVAAPGGAAAAAAAAAVEAGQAGKGALPSPPRNFSACTFKGTTLQYLIEVKSGEFSDLSLGKGNTFFFVFNGGFGNFMESKKLSLLWSWLNDLYCLTALQIPLFFTCANDYADVQGEYLVMTKLLGARYLASPRRNPFVMATHLADPKDHEKWARGNIFWYAVQGFDPRRRNEIDIKKSDRQAKMAEAIQQPDFPPKELEVQLPAQSKQKSSPSGVQSATDAASQNKQISARPISKHTNHSTGNVLLQTTTARNVGSAEEGQPQKWGFKEDTAENLAREELPEANAGKETEQKLHSDIRIEMAEQELPISRVYEGSLLQELKATNGSRDAGQGSQHLPHHCDGVGTEDSCSIKVCPPTHLTLRVHLPKLKALNDEHTHTDLIIKSNEIQVSVTMASNLAGTGKPQCLSKQIALPVKVDPFGARARFSRHSGDLTVAVPLFACPPISWVGGGGYLEEESPGGDVK